MAGFIISITVMALVLHSYLVLAADDVNRLAAHLKKRLPQVKWDTNSMLLADINCDGIPDHAVLGRQGNKVVVAVLLGPLSNMSRIHAEYLSVGKDSQDSLCFPEVRLTIEEQDYDPARFLGEELTGFRRSKTCKGINVSNDACDSFHFYWDHDQNRLRWWRL